MYEFVEISGLLLEVYHLESDAEQPTLVFLHEGLGCIRMWRDFPQAVAEATGCNLLVYSRGRDMAGRPLPRCRAPSAICMRRR